MVGGLLIAAAAVVVFAGVAGRVGSHGTAVVVATRVLPAGASIGPGDLATSSLSAPAGARRELFSDPSTLLGRTLAVALAPGEMVEASMLAAGGTAALRPVNVSVAPWSLMGLSPGEPVDVLATSPAGSSASGASAAGSSASGSSASGSSASGSSPAGTAGAGESPVTLVARGAVLLSVEPRSSGLLSGSVSDKQVVTLGVADLDEAEALVGAAQGGDAVLVRAEPSDGTGLGAAPAG